MNLIAFLLLLTPLVWELISDRNGETPKQKKLDVFIRVLIALIVALVGFFIADKPIVDGFVLSLAIHFMLFDYLIIMILNRRVYEKKVNWFSHLSKSYTDDVLRQWSPWTRFFIKLGVLSGGVILYWV